MPGSREGLAKMVARQGLDERVVRAFFAVAREDFVPPIHKADAYRDRPIPIPGNQTTSQPTLIALMIDTAAIGPEDKVLEVGGGYGFQTALLAELAGEVYSVDRDPDLVEAARANLGPRSHVHILEGDGWAGLPDHAPFDAIVVSAAAEGLPESLADQLAEGGRLVIPLKEGGSDDVWLLRKDGGRVHRVRLVSPARFVPLVKESEDEG
jgi:protein-L-isoaspartate(D-aspartate) O-methyltransferase